MSKKESISENKNDLEKLYMIQRTFFNKEGEVIEFEARPYLKQIYLEESPFVAVMASRQMGKSLWLAVESLLELSSSGNRSLIYATSNMNQLGKFRSSCIAPQFQYNPRFKKKALTKKSINNSRELKLSNGSVMSLCAIGHDVEGTRGITASTLIIDEIQDIPRKHLDVILECAAAFAGKARYLVGGTCKHESNLMFQIYLDSCQYEWIITCRACEQANPPIGMEHIDPMIPYLHCSLCKHKLDPRNGLWVAQNPLNQRICYRIPRVIDPETVWRSEGFDGILDKYERYLPEKFFNEVMALPSIDGAGLITRKELAECCVDREMMDPNQVPEFMQNATIIAGVDWSVDMSESSNSHTGITISRVLPGHIETVYMKRFMGPLYEGINGPDRIQEEIRRLVSLFHVNLVVSDHGVGHKENLRLRGALGNLVAEIQYVDTFKSVKWDQGARLFTASKTETMDRFYNQLRAGRFKFPREKSSMDYLEDLMNQYLRYDEAKRKRFYEKSGKGPDDFAHMLNYTLIGAVELFNDQCDWLKRYAFTN